MTTPASVMVGDNISASTSVTVKNVGIETASNFAVQMFHSVDDTITTADLPLINGATTAPITLLAGDSLTVTFPGLEIPAEIPQGSGYLGAIVDVGDVVVEGNEGDNTLAAPVFVDTPFVNLILSQMTTPASVMVGDDISASTSVTVKNVGTGTASNFAVQMVHSVDDTITTADLPLTNGVTTSPVTLLAGDSLTITFPGLEIPAETPRGQGYLGAIVDVDEVVAESNEGDNTLAAPVFVDTSFVNLYIADIIAPPSVESRDTIDVTVVVGNAGNVASDGFTVHLNQLEADSTSAAGGFYENMMRAGLAAGDTAVVTFSDIEVPVLSPPGPGFVRAHANGGGLETNYEDNYGYQPFVVGGAGDTVCVYFEDFSDGPAGWTPVSLTGQPAYWHWEDDPYFSPEAKMVCSTADSLWDLGYWDAGYNGYWPWSGYGHNWRQRLRKTYTLPAAPVSMDFELSYDTEPSFDYLYLQVRPVPGDTFTTIASYTGSDSTLESVDLSAWAGQPVEFEFFFESDNAYDDFDGYHQSDPYPVAIDDIMVTGYPTETFEAGDEGWTALGVPPTPGSFRLVETPQCFPGFPACDTTSTGEPFDACHAWVAYDSLTGEFPYRVPGASEYETDQSIAIQSPPIPLPTDGNRYYLECDVYWDIPPGAHLYVLMDWSHDGVTWFESQYAYGGDQGWTHFSVDISPDVLAFIDHGVPLTDFTFRWRVQELHWPEPFTGATPGPYFDNISVKVAGTATPGVNCTPDCGTATDVAVRTPAVSSLAQNVPNPFNPTTAITFSLAQAGPVELAIYDVTGRLVRTLVKGNRPAAQHTVSWDGKDERGSQVSSGVYFYRLRAGRFTATRKMVLLK
jgi:hypothetical protein